MTVVALSPGANVSWLGSLTRIVTTLVLPVALAWGFVHFLHGRLHRGDIREVPAIAAAPGPITLRVKLPGHHAGIAEPIVVLGRSGQAVMVYLKLFPHNQVRIGIEFWGRRSDESALFSVPCAEAQLAITCFLPALFPPEGDPQWGGVPRSSPDAAADPLLPDRRPGRAADGARRLPDGPASQSLPWPESSRRLDRVGSLHRVDPQRLGALG